MISIVVPKFGKKNGGIGDQRKNQDHLNHRFLQQLEYFLKKSFEDTSCHPDSSKRPPANAGIEDDKKKGRQIHGPNQGTKKTCGT